MILALIPAYDEAGSIAKVIEETSKYVDEVVVIDDGSKDKTSEIANCFGATVLRHSRNMGVGAAMRTGIEYAKKVRPSVVVTIDGDGQHDPKEIPRIVQPIISRQADFVLGSRFFQHGKLNMPLIKLVGNKLLSLFISVLLGVRITDVQTGFRALDWEALMALNLEADHTYVQEMIIELCLKGYKLKEIPTKVKPRKHGNSKVTSNIFKYITKTLPSIFRAYACNYQKLMIRNCK